MPDAQDWPTQRPVPLPPRPSRLQDWPTHVTDPVAALNRAAAYIKETHMTETTPCENTCSVEEPYGFVIEAGCPVHEPSPFTHQADIAHPGLHAKIVNAMREALRERNVSAETKDLDALAEAAYVTMRAAREQEPTMADE